MAEFGVESHQKEEMIDITAQINAKIPKNLTCGVCHIFCPHSTAGLTVTENADPCLKQDLLYCLDQMAPQKDEAYLHAEGNSASHIKAALTGFSLTIPVKNGALQMGIWQGIYFCEFDGPRFRRVHLMFQAASE